MILFVSKGRILLPILFLFFAIPLISCSPRLPSSTVHRNLAAPVSLSGMNEDILHYVNEYRQTKGLAALQMNPVMSAEAAKHSADMATKKTPFGHEGFEDRVKTIAQKMGPLHSWAENVAFGNLSAREVVDGWLHSPGHRRNIEGNYEFTGIGVATDDSGAIFFTQIFGKK